MAENQNGLSESLETNVSIIAKNPFGFNFNLIIFFSHKKSSVRKAKRFKLS